MVRIVRGMKFDSYREFQHYVHELSIAHATSLDTMQTGPAGKSAISTQVRASLDQDVKNLNRLVQSLEPQRIAALVRRLYAARHVVLLGGDLAANLVNFLEHLLIILGLPVTSATSPAEVVHKVRLLGKRDLVIAVSHGRGLRQTVEGLRQARANGAYCVGITNTLVSPIGQFAHEFFLTSIATPSFGSSYVAPMALFNVIVRRLRQSPPLSNPQAGEAIGAGTAPRLPLVRIMRIRLPLFRHGCFAILAGTRRSLTVASRFAVEPPSPPTYDIRMENTWIPMKDGVRLAVTLYMPDGGKAGEKFPAVLEYHPYRKDDGTAAA